MRWNAKVGVAALLLGLAACGGDGAGPSDSFESIAGSYAGSMAGISQGVALAGTFSLTIAQTRGDATGTWAIQGQLTDGFDVVNVQGTGTLSGTVGSGTNPSVNLTIRSGACPNYQSLFSGTYDSANRRLTLIGTVDFLASNCSVVLSYPMTVVLNR